MKKAILLPILFALAGPGFSQTDYETCRHGLPPAAVERNGAAALAKVKYTPSVVRYNASGDVLLEAFVEGAVSKLSLRVDGVANDLNDAGVNGDKTAGDNVYSLKYPAQAIVARLKTEDVFRPFLGFLELYEGGVKTVQYNIFPMIRTAEMPDVNATPKGPGIQASSHVLNIVGPNDKNVQYETVAQKFYQYYSDKFDFLHFVHNPGYFGNRYHAGVKNAVAGIGLAPMDNSAAFGSKGFLKGFNVFPLPALYDGASNACIHELGHQWINFAAGTPFETGIPHWPISNVGLGVMGISIGGPGGPGGAFSKNVTPASGGYNVTSNPPGTALPGYNAWELYLMGLIPKSEVTPNAVIFKNQSVTPADGFYASSDFNTYTIDQFTAKMGERVPNSAQSPKKFKIGTIVLSDALLTPDEMAYFHFMTLRAELKVPVNTGDGFSKVIGQPFFVATGGRGSLDLSLADAVGVEEDFEKPTFSVFPNPFTEYITASFSGKRKQKVAIDLLDMLGRKVAQTRPAAGETPDFVRFETKALPAGVYFLTVSDGRGSQSRMVIKTN
jgi:Secretion system C-terminal sorting domain